jgi:hypothetical protein
MSKFPETRIGEHEVGVQMGMEIAPEGVRLLFAEIGFDATDGEVAATVASAVFASVRLSAASQSFCSEKREKMTGYKREH